MPVSVRLKRCGARNRPTYRVVAADDRSKRDGRAIEILGHYNPLMDPPSIQIKTDRVDHWVAQGAQVSSTVKRLLKMLQKSSRPASEPGQAPPQ